MGDKAKPSWWPPGGFAVFDVHDFRKSSASFAKFTAIRVPIRVTLYILEAELLIRFLAATRLGRAMLEQFSEQVRQCYERAVLKRTGIAIKRTSKGRGLLNSVEI
jgi:hypothetical protein